MFSEIGGFRDKLMGYGYGEITATVRTLSEV
jgi:hypothetical protein